MVPSGSGSDKHCAVGLLVQLVLGWVLGRLPARPTTNPRTRDSGQSAHAPPTPAATAPPPANTLVAGSRGDRGPLRRRTGRRAPSNAAMSPFGPGRERSWPIGAASFPSARPTRGIPLRVREQRGDL